MGQRSPYEKAFNYEKKRLGKLFGQPFAGYQVDYTAQDQTPSLLFNKKMYKVEIEGPKFAQPGMPNCAFYCVHGDYDAIDPGDILVPLRTDSSTPRVTVLNTSIILSLFSGGTSTMT